MTEHDEQVALFEWAQLMANGRYPDLHYLHAIPNGGLRHKATAAKMKAEGAKPGVPDICLPVPKAGFHGLYIEMKFGKNTPTEEQTDYLRFLFSKHYCCAVCYDFYQAQEVIEWYMELKDVFVPGVSPTRPPGVLRSHVE